MPHTLHVRVNSEVEFWDQVESYVLSLVPELTKIGFSLITNDSVFENIEPNTPKRRVELCRQYPLVMCRMLQIFLKKPPHQNNEYHFDFHIHEFNGFTIPVRFDPQQNIRAVDVAEFKKHFEVTTESHAQVLVNENVNGNKLTSYNDAISTLLQTAASIGVSQVKAHEENNRFLLRATKGISVRLRKEREISEEQTRQVLEDVHKQKLALEEERLKLNRSESRGVRRELLKKMQELVLEQSKFERSKETKESDFSVRVACSIAAGIGCCLLIDALVTLGFGVAGPAFYAPFIAGSALLATTAIGIIRYEMLRSKRNSDTDFSIMQYSRDMYRMSWIAELIFESKTGIEGSEVDVPLNVLEHFSKSLFERTPDGVPVHPFDELTRMLKKFKKASVSSSGISVEKDDAKKE